MPTLATLIEILSTSQWAYFKSFGCFFEKKSEASLPDRAAQRAEPVQPLFSCLFWSLNLPLKKERVFRIN